MFLSREYRARAIGLAVAYAVVITGLIIGAAMEPSPAPAASQGTPPTAERQQTNSPADSAADLPRRCGTVC
jgi:hypothetical protein